MTVDWNTFEDMEDIIMIDEDWENPPEEFKILWDRVRPLLTMIDDGDYTEENFKEKIWNNVHDLLESIFMDSYIYDLILED